MGGGAAGPTVGALFAGLGQPLGPLGGWGKYSACPAWLKLHFEGLGSLPLMWGQQVTWKSQEEQKAGGWNPGDRAQLDASGDSSHKQGL